MKITSTGEEWGAIVNELEWVQGGKTFDSELMLKIEGQLPNSDHIEDESAYWNRSEEFEVELTEEQGKRVQEIQKLLT